MNTKNQVIPFYRPPRSVEYLRCKKINDIYFMVNYRLPEDIARKIIREYLFPDVIKLIHTIIQQEDDDFWFMHYLWQDNNRVNYLRPAGSSKKYVMDLTNFGF